MLTQPLTNVSLRWYGFLNILPYQLAWYHYRLDQEVEDSTQGLSKYIRIFLSGDPEKDNKNEK